MIDDPMPLVGRIPAGEFIMGADDTEEDERPSHRVYVDEFSIGIHPVTNDEYARFVQETRHPDRKSTRLNSSHIQKSRMPSSA